MTSNQSSRVFAPLAWAVLYFVLGFVSYRLNGTFVASGYLWLPAGVVVGALMLTTTERWGALMLALLAAQLLLGGVAERELWRMALLAANEIGVAAIAVWLVRRAPFPLEGLYFVRALLLVGVGASLASGLFGALWFSATQHLPFWSTLRVWSLSDLVGILIVTPVLAGWSRFRAVRSGGIDRADFLLGLASFAGLLITAWLAFGSEIDRVILDINFSTTYLPLFCVALVTILWGGRGGSLAVVVLALIAFVYNSLGRGPFVELVQLHSSNALLELQIYLAVAALLSLLISTLKTTREQSQEDAANWRDDVELALTVSRQLVYCIDPVRARVTWSGDVQGLLGLAPEALASIDQVLAHVHPLDQARLRQRWLDDDSDDARPGMSLRLMLPAGQVSEVTDISRSMLDPDDSLAIVAGAWQVGPAQGAQP
ncbi:MASE1 domain-containing protein [Herbaspirillum sp. alder98]|uniref:MASE1 domain-containing protein n=1 Tax=Herbaspirillum sp. alder98 TaxID=2913096 RepID=UPI001CD89FE2|nr:MASE1 domain-containing protein [Herbaspirillum sp. alder98]MCA1323627.1 MASE1 domain-containing protein [Herbaspirillum sp. alder98]